MPKGQLFDLKTRTIDNLCQYQAIYLLPHGLGMRLYMGLLTSFTNSHVESSAMHFIVTCSTSTATIIPLCVSLEVPQTVVTNSIAL